MEFKSTRVIAHLANKSYDVKNLNETNDSKKKKTTTQLHSQLFLLYSSFPPKFSISVNLQIFATLPSDVTFTSRTLQIKTW